MVTVHKGSCLPGLVCPDRPLAIWAEFMRTSGQSCRRRTGARDLGIQDEHKLHSPSAPISALRGVGMAEALLHKHHKGKGQSKSKSGQFPRKIFT